MTEYYDVLLFCEILESTQGIVYRGSETKDDVTFRYYIGTKGKVVPIDCSEQDISFSTGRNYCFHLGVEFLIESIFPYPKIVEEE